jgi:putative tricarboxylic transport membrane protein
MAATVKNEERIASLVVIAGSLAYLAVAFNIPMPALQQQLGPDIFPKAIGFLMLFFGGVYAFQMFRGVVHEDQKRAEIIGAEEKIEGRADIRKMSIMIVLMIAYALVFDPLGYAISTFLMFMAGSLVMDRRHLVRDALIAVIASFGLYFAFSLLLRVHLPAGPLGLLDL